VLKICFSFSFYFYNLDENRQLNTVTFNVSTITQAGTLKSGRKSLVFGYPSNGERMARISQNEIYPPKDVSRK